jgi:hypothetical protein
MNIKFILIISLIVILLIYLIFNFNLIKCFEHFNKSISKNVFLSKNQLETFLINDSDNYYKTFNDIDFRVRNIKSINDYIINIKKSCIDIDTDNINKLIKYTKIADNNIKKIKIDGFDGMKCSNITWNIGLVSGSLYEAGLPHTRGTMKESIIVLPDTLLSIFNTQNSIVRTLIHEKIHIYQKMYPYDINKYLNINGYIKHSKKTSFINTRANPDLDEYIYMNKDKIIMKAVYKENASYISDVVIEPIDDYMYEHPLEYMAYVLSNIK